MPFSNIRLVERMQGTAGEEFVGWDEEDEDEEEEEEWEEVE
jgi:hypothetical protein